jgi:hypothetical protein
MDLRDEKRRLFSAVVDNRVTEKKFLEFAMATGVGAPRDILEKWRKRFYANRSMKFPVVPRLVNRFCVGADPEFVLGEPLRNAAGALVGFPPGTALQDRYRYIHAQNVGMSTLDPLGCDMSGRQAELRVCPSRFVLEVVASIMDTLAWGNEFWNLSRFHLLAPGLFADDGIGGHIHIGRRHGAIESIIPSLDTLTAILEKLCLIDTSGSQRRRRVTNYGKAGDWRTQTHGFEYRTMPTWLHSPLSAYLTLVFAKLAVFHNLGNIGTKETNLPVAMKNLLRSYANDDDDARIALAALEVLGWPQYKEENFSNNWNLVPYSHKFNPTSLYIPPVIPPSEDSVRKLFRWFTGAIPFKADLPEPTWKPFRMPAGFSRVGAIPHSYGTTETAQGMVAYQYTATINNHASRGCIHVIHPYKMAFDRKAMMKYIKDNCKEIRQLRTTIGSSTDNIEFHIPQDCHRNGEVKKDLILEIRRLMVKSGCLPVCKAENYEKLVGKDFQCKGEPPEVQPLSRVDTVFPEGEVVQLADIVQQQDEGTIRGGTNQAVVETSLPRAGSVNVFVPGLGGRHFESVEP